MVLGPGLMVHSISQEIEINSITVSFSDGHSYSDLELESFAKILMQVWFHIFPFSEIFNPNLIVPQKLCCWKFVCLE